ncbi:DUF1643 domain-containing protein [Streptomyces sp. NPDC005195]|uniref:DUF1643 domain-containing protein n=1 Tax=Streptomyces sp. NPDC005195 TaxID=3154561 RepID=UPI0033BD4E3B
MTQPTTPPHPDVRRSAALSPCGQYRYLLIREWADTGKIAVFVLLNPSTADAGRDDNTTRRCITYARTWGCAGLLIANVYAWRSTKPSGLADAEDPVGPDNDRYLQTAAAVAHDTGGPLIVGWGTHAQPDRVAHIRALPGMHRLRALAVTQGGHPRHPLRLAGNLTPRPWGDDLAGGPRAFDQHGTCAVVVARPGLGDIRLGPYGSVTRAGSVASSLRQQRTSTQHVPGTTISVEPYFPEHDHLDPYLPTDPDLIAALMDSEPGGDGTGRNFPGLWARLHAQEGYESAARIWKAAGSAYDLLHHDPAEAE